MPRRNSEGCALDQPPPVCGQQRLHRRQAGDAHHLEQRRQVHALRIPPGLVWVLPRRPGQRGGPAGFASMVPAPCGRHGRCHGHRGHRAYSAAKAVDWLGKKTNTDYGKDKPTATAGVHDAMGKVIGINAGIVGAAGAAKVAPAAAAAAMRHPEKLAAGSKAAVDFASGAFDQGPPPASKAGYSGVAASKAYDWLKTRR